MQAALFSPFHAWCVCCGRAAVKTCVKCLWHFQPRQQQQLKFHDGTQREGAEALLVDYAESIKPSLISLIAVKQYLESHWRFGWCMFYLGWYALINSFESLLRSWRTTCCVFGLHHSRHGTLLSFGDPSGRKPCLQICHSRELQLLQGKMNHVPIQTSVSWGK